VMKQIDRCVMTTRPQPDGIERDLDVLRTIRRDRGGFLAIGALVAETGALRVGDDVHPQS
jgi:MOSC domain-containing protein